MLKMPVTINPLDKTCHSESNFKEQVAVLHPTGFDGERLSVIRSWYKVGESAKIDADFVWLDDKIDSGEVSGVFHTHPPGCVGFSSDDESMQIAFAKTYGKRLLWHGVQALGSDYYTLRCMHMLTPGVIMVYDFGQITSDIHDNILLLPLPPSIERRDRTFVMEMSGA